MSVLIAASFPAAAATPARPVVTVTPSAGAPNTVLTVAGTGFPANEIVGLYVDTPGVYIGFPGPRTDSNGTFRESDALPIVQAGHHMICADTMHPSPQAIPARACVAFLVKSLLAASSSGQSSGGIPALPLALAFLAIGLVVGVGVGAAIRGRR